MKGLNNQSGFTIIELVLSFVFVFTIAFSMYQLVFNYKEKRDQESLSAMMTDYKNEVTLAIQRDISDRSLKSIDYCTNGAELVEKCLVLYFNDGTKKNLSIEVENISYDGENRETNYIKYGNVNYKNDEALLVDFKANYMLYRTYEDDDVGKNVTIYKIAIPIYHNDLGDRDYGIYVTAVGYNYDSTKVDGDGDSVPTENIQTADGRRFMSDYHMKCTTSNSSRTDLYKQSMVIVFKTGSDLNKSVSSSLLGNLNNTGSALVIDDAGHICYVAYIKSSGTDKPALHKVCSSTTIAANTNYFVVGGFNSNASASDIDTTGATLSVYVNKTAYTSTINGSYTNNRVSGSSFNYAVGAEPGNVINLSFYDGIVRNVALYNGVAPTQTHANNVGTTYASSTANINSAFGTTGRIFHYDFTDTSVYANYCID